MRLKTRLEPDLRRRPLDTAAFERRRAQLQANIRNARGKYQQDPTPSHQGILGRELVQHGELLGLSQDLDQAHASLTEAIEHWRAMDCRKALLMAHLKLATVLRYQGKPLQALTLIEDLMIQTEQKEMALYRPFLELEEAMLLWTLDRKNQALHNVQRLHQLFTDRGAQALSKTTEQLLQWWTTPQSKALQPKSQTEQR